MLTLSEAIAGPAADSTTRNAAASDETTKRVFTGRSSLPQDRRTVAVFYGRAGTVDSRGGRYGSARRPRIRVRHQLLDRTGKRAFGQVGQGHGFEHGPQVRPDRHPHVAQRLGRALVSELLRPRLVDVGERTLDRTDHFGQRDVLRRPGQPVAAHRRGRPEKRAVLRPENRLRRSEEGRRAWSPRAFAPAWRAGPPTDRAGPPPPPRRASPRAGRPGPWRWALPPRGSRPRA